MAWGQGHSYQVHSYQGYGCGYGHGHRQAHGWAHAIDAHEYWGIRLVYLKGINQDHLVIISIGLMGLSKKTELEDCSL